MSDGGAQPAASKPAGGRAASVLPAGAAPCRVAATPNRDNDFHMALIDKIFGTKKTLSQLDRQELRKEEILLTKQRDRLFKRIETDFHRQAENLPAGRDPEIAGAAQGAGAGF